MLRDDGELDRDRTIAGLLATERLDPLVRIFPELKEILIDESRADRDSLATSLEVLSSCHRDFREAVAHASKYLDLGSVFGADASRSRMSGDDFGKWLDEKISELAEYLADADRLGSLLKPGCDLPRRDLAARVASIAGLRQANLRQPDDHLVLRDDGELDRERTMAGLRASERFDPLIRVFPDLKDVLVDQARVNQGALKACLDDLATKHRQFREATSTVERHIDLPKVLGADAKQSELSVTDLAQLLERELRGLQALLDQLDRTSALIKPAHDVSLADLSSRLQLLETLCQSACEIRRLGNRLGLDSQDQQIRGREWGDFRAKAEWIIGFLDEHADCPPEPLVRVATDAGIREDVVDAVRRNLAVKSAEFMESWEFVNQLFEPDQEVSTGIVVGRAPVPTLHEWVDKRRGDTHLIQGWVKFCELREEINQAGLGFILSELLDGRLAVEDAMNAFLVRCYRCWLDWVYERDPALRRFATDAHERQIDKFKSLDRDAVRLSYARIREARLTDPRRPDVHALDAPGSSELGTLLREVNKKKRHLPLRQLFARIPTILLRLKPCLMMSPLAVSTYLDSREINFDVVIFDEASQVRPFDAISSIYRGRQLVVAGDQKQLPPTSFFERTLCDEETASETDEPEESLTDFDSILDVCLTLGLPRRRLRWHYRSEREPLIAFSNRHFYDNELVTFPSVLDADGPPAIRFVYLPNGCWRSGSSGGFNAFEALKTAELVMNHFRSNPERSLGVIAFSLRQQTAIYDELERLRMRDPSLEKFFNEDLDEPFFVKNLESVQGDERDFIFLSVGYGPDENGRVAMRFGPLNRQGGHRRLNVAVTRARCEMTVVSSMRSQDIDLARTSSEGVKLLRAYLDYAERGVSALGSEITYVDEVEHDSPFEREVAEALKQRGMVVRRQIGCSGYRIDLALMDPANTGRFVLGIECDGATYHNSATARDRDRLRQEVLESLGWTIVRVWSTDWIKDSVSQVNRVIAAFNQCCTKKPRTAVFVQRNWIPEQPAEEVALGTHRRSPQTTNSAMVEYSTIEAVPTSAIENLVLSILGNYGVTDESELVVFVARQLGFLRTGSKIRARIAECVEDLLSERKLARADENRIKLNPSFDWKRA